jgi:UDP-glucose 4-epimerase
MNNGLNNSFLVNFVKVHFAQCSAGLSKGHGTEVRSYMIWGDMALWIAPLLAKKVDNSNTSIYNLGSDRDTTVENLTKSVANTLNPKLIIKINKSDTIKKSGNRNSSYVPSLSKAKSELQLDIWTPLEKSIRQMVLFKKATKE